MTSKAIELLQYITDAIDNNLTDDIINERIEEVANNEEISNQEYNQIYKNVMLAYKVKYNIWYKR